MIGLYNRDFGCSGYERGDQNEPFNEEQHRRVDADTLAVGQAAEASRLAGC
jgi:hypothetical protein